MTMHTYIYLRGAEEKSRPSELADFFGSRLDVFIFKSEGSLVGGPGCFQRSEKAQERFPCQRGSEGYRESLRELVPRSLTGLPHHSPTARAGREDRGR